MDEVFLGPLVRLLKDRGLYDRTMIIVTSDHGEEFYEHGGWQHGQTLYDEIIKVPLVVKLPDSRLKGSRVRPAAQTIDVLPTVLEELNVRHSRRAFDGRSLFPLIEGRERRAREIPADVYGLVEFPSPLKNANPFLRKFALVAGTHKLVFSVNHNNYRFFFSPPPRLSETIEIELYDLARDPKELDNLAAREPDLVRSMMARIEKYVGEGRRSARGRDASLDARRLEELRALGYIR